MDLTRARLQAGWWLVPTVTGNTTLDACDRSMGCPAGARHLVTSGTPLARTARAPAP